MGEVPPSPTRADHAGLAVRQPPSSQPESSGVVDFRAGPRQCGQSAALAAQAAAAQEVVRGQRKERKALTKAEAKAKRDARYAARKARN